MAGKKRQRINDPTAERAHLRVLRRAAERGDLEAQHDLGASYATGDVDGTKNDVEAVKWYTGAAERGHAESQYDLGFMLILGEGTEKDIAKGLWWMEQAVANGWDYAARVLSEVYEKGLYGVEPNTEKAAYWNERAGDYKT